MTVEELIQGLRATGENMPRRFIRAGLVYHRHGNVYHYEPVEPFTVDGIEYQERRCCSSVMVELKYDSDPEYGYPSRMDYTQPPAEAELDVWMHGNGDYLYPGPIQP